MQRLEVSGAVRLIYGLLGVKGLKFSDTHTRVSGCGFAGGCWRERERGLTVQRTRGTVRL